MLIDMNYSNDEMDGIQIMTKIKELQEKLGQAESPNSNCVTYLNTGNDCQGIYDRYPNARGLFTGILEKGRSAKEKLPEIIRSIREGTPFYKFRSAL